jgi:hypothetical protein
LLNSNLNEKLVMRYLIAFFLFVSCNQQSEPVAVMPDKVLPDTTVATQMEQNYNFHDVTNIDFRKEVFPNLKKQGEKESIDSLLIVLDKHNTSFCAYMKRLFALNDSCYAKGKVKYPDPSEQIEYSKWVSKCVSKEEKRYSDSLGLSKRQHDKAGWFYAFNQDVRRVCGNF